MATPALPDQTAASQPIHFVLSSSGPVDGRESRIFRVEARGRVLGTLTIACERGEMVSAAFEPKDGPGGEMSGTGQIARRADHRLCHSGDLRL